jgi:hypothetical protein
LICGCDGQSLPRRSFCVGTEANNADWLNASAAQYSALYDATVCGLSSAIPRSHLTVGSHLTVDYGRWDATAFIRHAWNGTCACCGPDSCIVPLNFLGVSYYESAPGAPGDLSAFERIALGLSTRAVAAGFAVSGGGGGGGDVAGRRALEFGVEEGRILAGPDGLQLGTHAVGADYQVSWDGLLFIKTLRTGSLSYISRWSVNSAMSGPYGLQGFASDPSARQQRVDNGAANLARLCSRMAGDAYLPNSNVTMMAPDSAPADWHSNTKGGSGRSIVDMAASTNCSDSMVVLDGGSSCVLRLLLVHHFTAIDLNASAARRTSRNLSATVCGLPATSVEAKRLTSSVTTDGHSDGAVSLDATATVVGGGDAVWWRDWWADATRANLSASDYIPGLSAWADEPPLASTRAKQLWAAGLRRTYRRQARLKSQQMPSMSCWVVGVGDGDGDGDRAGRGGEEGEACVSCVVPLEIHSAALLEIDIGGGSAMESTKATTVLSPPPLAKSSGSGSGGGGSTAAKDISSGFHQQQSTRPQRLPCTKCIHDWSQIRGNGTGPDDEDLCSLVNTCATEVGSCDFTLPPDQVFATCVNLTATTNPQPQRRRFNASSSGSKETYYIAETSGRRGPFVLFVAPRFSGDYWNWACFYVFSYLATQGIATFTAMIPDAVDATHDTWNHVPSFGARPYNYSCIVLGSCADSHHYLHDRHIEDVIQYAVSLGYSANESVWWGYSEGAAMVSQHLNYLLKRAVAHLPMAMVLEATGGQYCFAFSTLGMPLLHSTQYWRQCSRDMWSSRNCCPSNLTEQFYYENEHEYKKHPPVLLVQSDSDESADPNGAKFYHEAMQVGKARSALATWSGTAHGITPYAWGFAASYVKAALRAVQ